MIDRRRKKRGGLRKWADDVLTALDVSADAPPSATISLTAIRNPMKAGTRIRALTDNPPGVPELGGYLGEAGHVVPHPHHGTGDHEWAIVVFDDDPVMREPGYINMFAGEVPRPMWAWRREDLEVVRGRG